MSALTGNFAALADLQKRLADIAANGQREIEARSAKAVELVLKEQFDTGSGPDGNAWAALKPSTIASGRTPPPLTKTRKMRNSATASPIKGVRVRIAKPAGFHQDGTSRMAARPMVPTGNTLPTRWKSAVSEAAMDVLRERFG
jgi:hypothetical protein